MTTATLKVTSPYNGELIETLPYHTAKDVEHFLTAAHALTRSAPLKVSEREGILKKAIERFRQDRDAFALMIAREGGKPLTDALVEVDRGIQGIENAIEVMKSHAGSEIPMGRTPSSAHRLAFTTREPIGVVVAISAFNHPFNLIVHQVIPAVATGCPVIVKPAGATPLSCRNLIQTLHDCGLPKDWCQIAILPSALAESLVTDPRVAFFSIIGSSRIGWMLRSKLAPGTRCALEHGGVAPVIIEADADLERLIPPLAKGGYYHAGQVCVSVQRVFVHSSHFDTVAEAFQQRVSRLKVGDPTLKETEVGPLIQTTEVDRVAGWVEEARASGAQVVIGGSKLSDTLYAPTLLLNPSHEAKISTQEVFGPVVSLYSYDDVNEAVTRANSLDVAFQAAVFTQSIDKAFGIAQKLAASTVMINDHTAFRVDWMPFAGRRSSGLGTGGIPYTMEDMTQEKLLVFHSPEIQNG